MWQKSEINVFGEDYCHITKMFENYSPQFVADFRKLASGDLGLMYWCARAAMAVHLGTRAACYVACAFLNCVLRRPTLLR